MENTVAYIVQGSLFCLLGEDNLRLSSANYCKVHRVNGYMYMHQQINGWWLPY